MEELNGFEADETSREKEEEETRREGANVNFKGRSIVQKGQSWNK